MKGLAEEFKNQFTCSGEKPEKYVTFTDPIEKEVTKIDKNHYQILSIIFLKEFLELNVNLDTVMKNVKLVESNISFGTVFSRIKALKMI